MKNVPYSESALENARALLAEAYDARDPQRLLDLSRLIDTWQCSLWQQASASRRAAG